MHVAVWPFYFVLYLPYIAEYFICVILDSNLIIKAKILFYNILIKLNKKNEKQLSEKVKEQELKLEKVTDAQRKNRSNPYKIIINKNNNVKLLIIIMLICILTGLCTPLGDTPYTYLIKTMQGNTTQNINEHLPLTLINQKDILCVIIALISILIFTDTKIKLNDLLMISGLILLCLFSRRQISMLLLIGVFIFNKLVCSFLKKYDRNRDVNNLTKFLTTIFGKIIVISVTVLIVYDILSPKIKSKEQFINIRTYPVDACNYIIDNLDIQNMKIYNEYNYGSYMLYRGIPVFIDSRADLYAPEFNSNESIFSSYSSGRDIFSDFINISNINVHYEEKFEKYGITHVIVYRNSKLNLLLVKDSNYKQLYSDDSFIIYERSYNK